MSSTVIEFVEEPEKSYGFSESSVVIPESKTALVPVDSANTTPKKRGPGRPPKDSYNNANVYTDPNGIITTKKSHSPESQYEKAYKTNSNLLYGVVAQADNIYQNIETELVDLRNHPAKGGKNRHQTMSEYMNTQVGLLNTKITAIREIDGIRHKINEFVLKKMQLDKDSVDENSDKVVMDAYYALVNASNYGLPQFNSPLSATSINTGINLDGQRLQTNNIIPSSEIIPANVDNSVDQSFEQYKANLTPVQRKMILDNDPNIKTVVVYDQSSGRKYFDVINVQTGQSVPGVTRPGDFLLDNMRIDARNGIAVNSNINQSFPLVIVGNKVADEL